MVINDQLTKEQKLSRDPIFDKMCDWTSLTPSKLPNQKLQRDTINKTVVLPRRVQRVRKKERTFYRPDVRSDIEGFICLVVAC